MTRSGSAREPLELGAALRCVLALAGVFLFYTNLDSYAYAAYRAAPPVHWVLAFAAAAAVLVLLDVRRPLSWLRSPALAWVLFYLLITAVWSVGMKQHLAIAQELEDRIRSMVFLIAFVVIFDDPLARRAAMLGLAACVVIASLTNVAELLSLVTFADLGSPARVPGRAAGFHINPNRSGLSIAFGLAAAVGSIPKPWRMPLLLVAAAGVLTTFSRAAAICLIIVFLWLAWSRAISTWSVVLGSVCACLAFLYAVGYMDSNALLNSNTAARVSLEQDDSGRLHLAVKAWRLFASSPLIGNGLGSTRIWDEPVGAHNMYVTLAADHGVIGLLAFPALGLALAAASPGAAPFALALLAAGFASHGLLMDRYVLLLIALTATPIHASLAELAPPALPWRRTGWPAVKPGDGRGEAPALHGSSR